jgi:hypothetical protein
MNNTKIRQGWVCIHTSIILILSVGRLTGLDTPRMGMLSIPKKDIIALAILLCDICGLEMRSCLIVSRNIANHNRYMATFAGSVCIESLFVFFIQDLFLCC